MQKASQTLRQKASLEGKKWQSSHRSYSRIYQGQSSVPEEAQPRIRIPYKREHKFKYLIYSALLFLNFCSLFVLPVSTFATSKPSDANGKNVVKEEKTCPSGQYLNPETKRCKKFPPQKMKTCPEGYFLNVKTNRCKGEEKPHEVKACKEGYERNEQTHRCRKVHQNTGASNPVEVPKLGDKKEEQKKDFNGTTAVAGSAAVGLGIAIFQFKNEIFVIIRKIFLHK